MPARQIRYMISEGFLSPPTGGRAHAHYDEGHLKAIQRYQRLKRLGFPPAAIGKLMHATAGVPFPVAPGLTLLVDPQLLGAKHDLHTLRSVLERLLTDIFEGDGA